MQGTVALRDGSAAATPTLKKKSSRPLYEQLYDHLFSMLQSGELKPGDQIPPELELVKRLGVGRVTVRRAIADLVQEGKLIRYAGKGTFVAVPKIERALMNVSSFTARLEGAGMRAGAQVLDVQIIPATLRLARELAVQEGAPIVAITRVRSSDGEPLALETSYISLERCPGLDRIDLNNVSLYHILQEHYGLSPVESRKTLEITQASPWEAEQLNVPSRAPLFLMRATVLGQGGPIEHAKILLRGDRFRFQI